MSNKVIARIIILSLFITTPLFADCGADHSISNDVAQAKQTRVNSLVTSVPDNGNIKGIVITSCGQCKLGYKEKPGCSLTIKIGESIYPVEGTGIHDHGDAHGVEGFCSAVRVAWATGQIKKDVFHAESFSLVGGSQ